PSLPRHARHEQRRSQGQDEGAGNPAGAAWSRRRTGADPLRLSRLRDGRRGRDPAAARPRYGSRPMMRRKCPHRWTLAERIAHRTRRDPISGCWLWQGALQRQGYGSVGYKNRTWLAHRLSWTDANGPIPKGKILCHRCDERRCVNPDHLFLGTWQANVDDLMAKRWRRRQAADSGRLHVFIRGRELIGDITWENDDGQQLDPTNARGVSR